MRRRSDPRGWLPVGLGLGLGLALASCREHAPTVGGTHDPTAGAEANAEPGAGVARVNANAEPGAVVARVDASASVRAASLDTSGLPVVIGDWIEKIDLSEGGLAYVTPPVGATERRPIVVAIHGAVDDPGLMCSAWRLVTDVYPFVVCPAGTPIGTKADGRKYVWRSTEQIERRALEAIAAVEARYPQHVVRDAPVVYAAFSQGATMAAPFLARHGKRFPRAVLTEGGHHAFEPAGLAEAYAKTGGERVLFTCSHAGCASSFELSRARLERAKVTGRVLFSGAHGHSIPPPVRESIHDALPWVVQDLPGWETYAAAPKLPSH